MSFLLQPRPETAEHLQLPHKKKKKARKKSSVKTFSIYPETYGF